MRIRKDDNVVVITGEDSTRGTATVHRVLRVLPEKGKVVVEGVNRVTKHVKPNRRNRQGGRLSKEMPINVSNVMLYCPGCKGGVRVGARLTPDGAKERYCKKCQASLGVLKRAPAKAKK